MQRHADVESRWRMVFIAALSGVLLLLAGSTVAQLLPQTPTRLIVKAEPGATVYLDGALEGSIPQGGELIVSIKEPDPRPRTLRVTLAGRRPFEQRVGFQRGQDTIVVAKLAEIVGKLEVLTTADAEILIDGKPTGRADARGRLELPSVRAGRVRLQIRRPGYLPEDRTVIISADELTTVSASLTAIASPTGPAHQAPDFAPHRSLVGHTDTVYAVEFSHDSRWLASGDRNGGMRLWDLSSGRQVRTWELGPYTINRVAFSPD